MSVSVSIAIPIYKVEDYIIPTLKSVIAQTYKNIELILVDDGTPDNSAILAEKFLSDSGFPYRIVHQNNMGLGEARNTGLKAATGEYVYFLDADDVILPFTIERLVGALNFDEDFIFCDFHYVKSEVDCIKDCEKKSPVYYTKDQITKEFLLRDKVILAPGTLYKREFLLSNDLFFAKMAWSEDQHFMWRVLGKVNKVGYIEEPLYQYFVRGTSIMNSTKAEKIADSYEYMKPLPSLYDKGSIENEFLLPRWVLGSISASARIGDFKTWKELFSMLDGKTHLKKLKKFPKRSVRIVSRIGLLSKKLFYIIMKKRSVC